MSITHSKIYGDNQDLNEWVQKIKRVNFIIKYSNCANKNPGVKIKTYINLKENTINTFNNKHMLLNKNHCYQIFCVAKKSPIPAWLGGGIRLTIIYIKKSRNKNRGKWYYCSQKISNCVFNSMWRGDNRLGQKMILKRMEVRFVWVIGRIVFYRR